MICPCKGCPERTITCHGFCERYQAWKAEDAGRKKWLKDHVPMYSDRASQRAREKIRKKQLGQLKK